MHDLESVQRKHERLMASPGDPRIRQVWGREALDLARAKDYTLEVDIQAWRARTGRLDYDNFYDVEPDSADMALLRDGFIEGDFFFNLGADEATEEALVLELFDATPPEADGYRSVQEIIGVVRVEPLLVGSLLSWGRVGEALLRLTGRGTVEIFQKDVHPVDLDNAYRYADVPREPPLTDAQVGKVLELLREPFLDDDDLRVLARLLQLAFAEGVEAELTARLAEGSEASVRAGSVVLALAGWARRGLAHEGKGRARVTQ